MSLLPTAAIGALSAMASPLPSAFKIIDPAVRSIFGEAPTLEMLLENDGCPFAHEAGVFISSDVQDTLYVTSNFVEDPDTRQKRTFISRVVLPKDGSAAHAEQVDAPDVVLPNGGVNYQDGIVFCAQGDLKTSGGLALMQTAPPYATRMLVDSFQGKPFNSPNDVVPHNDGSLWFTDPMYGSEQGIRPRPEIPQQVYRFDPKTNSTRGMAGDFGRPNGIAFNPNQTVVYVTDTDRIHGDGSNDPARVSRIYAFDLENRGGEPHLANKRVFADAEAGIPDGIKTDQQGNVYSGCGDGINIWSPGGVLLGKILIEGGAANFCFGRDGKMFILNEETIWAAQLGRGTKGALLNI